MFKERGVCPVLTIFKIFAYKYIFATTLIFQYHVSDVTSPFTWPFDSPYTISYIGVPLEGTEPLSSTVFEIFGTKIRVYTHTDTNTHIHTLQVILYFVPSSHAMYCIGQTTIWFKFFRWTSVYDARSWGQCFSNLRVSKNSLAGLLIDDGGSPCSHIRRGH